MALGLSLAKEELVVAVQQDQEEEEERGAEGEVKAASS